MVPVFGSEGSLIAWYVALTSPVCNQVTRISLDSDLSSLFSCSPKIGDRKQCSAHREQLLLPPAQQDLANSVQHQNRRGQPCLGRLSKCAQDYWQASVACSPAGTRQGYSPLAPSAPAPPSGPAWPACVQMKKSNDPGRVLPEPPPSSPTWRPSSRLPHLGGLGQQPQLPQALDPCAQFLHSGLPGVWEAYR